MSVEIDILYEGDLLCKATHGESGQSIATDAPADNGGKGELFSPTDLVGVALGTCIITIMGLVAKRSGIDLKGTQVHVKKEMAAAPARRVGELEVTITLPKGLNLSPEMRAKLEQAGKSCPVRQSLHPDIQLKENFIYL
jgi:putative redox protein